MNTKHFVNKKTRFILTYKNVNHAVERYGSIWTVWPTQKVTRIEAFSRTILMRPTGLYTAT